MGWLIGGMGWGGIVFVNDHDGIIKKESKKIGYGHELTVNHHRAKAQRLILILILRMGASQATTKNSMCVLLLFSCLHRRLHVTTPRPRLSPSA